MRTLFVVSCFFVTFTLLGFSYYQPSIAWSFVLVGPLMVRATSATCSS